MAQRLGPMKVKNIRTRVTQTGCQTMIATPAPPPQSELSMIYVK